MKIIWVSALGVEGWRGEREFESLLILLHIIYEMKGFNIRIFEVSKYTFARNGGPKEKLKVWENSIKCNASICNNLISLDKKTIVPMVQRT